MNVKIDSSWQKKLSEEFEKPYFAGLTEFVKKEYKDETVYPPPKYIFRAFNLCPFEKVKVVILGQDPYHGQRQANGLAFAVDENITVPPSLQNIFKEIQTDIDQGRKSNPPSPILQQLEEALARHKELRAMYLERTPGAQPGAPADAATKRPRR